MKNIWLWIIAVIVVLWYCCKSKYCHCIGTTTNVQPDVARYGDRNNFEKPVSMPASGQPVVFGGSSSGFYETLSGSETLTSPAALASPFGY